MDDQSFTVTSTYDPETNELTCTSEPSPIQIQHGNIGKITVRLQLKEGQPGSISFPVNAIKWSSPTQPDFPIAPTTPITEIVITAPNLHAHENPEEFPFEINFVYTSPDGKQVTDTGDPTIILEGTGIKWEEHPES